MRKIIFIISFLVISYLIADPLNETFEDGGLPAGWFVDGEQPAGWFYSTGYTEDHTTGSGSIMMFNCTGISDGQGANLNTPTMLVSETETSFSFWVSYFLIMEGFGNAASLYTDISSDGGTSWDMGAINHIDGQHGTGWQNITLDLSEYQDEIILVRFRAISDYGGYNIALDDITGPEIFVNEEPPGIAVNPTPVDNAEEQSVLQTLQWNASAGIVDGFKIFLGTDSEPTILDTVGNIYEYRVDFPLSYNSEYFWKIVPYNENGDAENAEIWSFSTVEDPSVILPYFEGFTAGTPNNWPINNWERAEGELMETDTELVWGAFGWASDSWLNNEAEAEPCARINIYGTGRNNWLITPPFELNNNDDYLKFDMALTQYGNSDPGQLGEDDLFAVVISYDNGLTWSANDTLQTWTSETPIPNETVPVVIDLPAFSGTVRIGFYGESFVANEDVDLFIDNIIIGGMNATLNQPEMQNAILENENNIRLTWDILESYNEVFKVYRNDVFLEEISGANFEYLDEALENGAYTYKISAEYGNIEIFSEESETIEVTVANEINPTQKMNLKNYPNPFRISDANRNIATTIHFELPKDSTVELAIYNLKGQLIKTLLQEQRTKGQHQVHWNGKDNRGENVASGIYFYRLKKDKETMTKKMILMK